MTLQTPRFWLDNGHLSKDEARGAFWFARQQWLDGLSDCSCAEWLGLSDAEFDSYMALNELPKPSRRHKKLWSVPEGPRLRTRAPKREPAPPAQSEAGGERQRGTGGARVLGAIDSFVASVNARLPGPGKLVFQTEEGPEPEK